MGIYANDDDKQAQGYLARKNFARKMFKYVYLTFFDHNYKIVFKVLISSPLET